MPFTPDELRSIGEGWQSLPPEEQERRSEASIEKHQEARERLFRDMERKVKLFGELRLTIETIPANMPTDEVHRQLDQAAIDMEAGLDPDTRRQLDEAAQLSREILIIQDELVAAMREVEAGRPVDDVHLNRQAAEVRVKEQRLLELVRNPDVLFFRNVFSTIIALKRKNAMVRQAEADPPIMLDRLGDGQYVANLGLLDTIRPDDIRSIEYRTFDVTIVLADAAFERISSRSVSGVQFSGLPLCLIKEHPGDGVDRDVVARHEQLHNLIDGAPFIRHDRPGLKFAQEAGTFDQSDTVETSPDSPLNRLLLRLRLFGGVGHERIKAQLLSQPAAADIVDTLHNEMLAALEEAEQRKFDDPRGVVLFREEPSAEEVTKTTRSFVSAGSEINILGQSALDLVERMIGRRGGLDRETAEVAEYLTKQGREVMIEFMRAALHVKTAIKLGRRLGPEAYDEAHALAFLLRPTQYRHMLRYLSHRFGRDRVTRELLLMKAESGSLTWAALEEIIDDLDKRRTPPLAADQAAWRERLARFVAAPDNVAELGIHSLDDANKVIRALGKVSEHMGLPGAEAAVVEVIRRRTMHAVIAYEAFDGFAGLPQLYTALEPAERPLFIEELTQYLRDDFQADLYAITAFDAKAAATPLESTPHWQVVRSMGLEDLVKRAISTKK